MSHALLLPGEEEPPVPPWKPRMPTDPDIQKKKTAEELLWEAAFDGDHETAGPILEAGGLDLNWRAVPRLGFFMPTEPGHFGWAPFHLACAYNRSTKLLKMLIDAGCDVNVKNKRGQTGWEVAKLNCRSKSLAFLETAASSQNADLYEQKRQWCNTAEYRAPNAAMQNWGGAGKNLQVASSTYVGQPHELLAEREIVAGKLEVLHKLELKVGSGGQLSPFEQQQVKPKVASNLVDWVGHDYHGEFIPVRQSELVADLEAVDAAYTAAVSE